MKHGSPQSRSNSQGLGQRLVAEPWIWVTASVPALLLVLTGLLLLVAHWSPLPRHSCLTSKNVYLVKQVKYAQPCVPPRPRQSPKFLRIPIPDPQPGEPEPINLDEGQQPLSADLILGMPEPPPPPPPDTEAHRQSPGSFSALRAPDSLVISGSEVVPESQEVASPLLRLQAGVTGPVPRRIAGGEPVLPPQARTASITGSVLLECVIDRHGRISEVEVLRGLPAGLTEAAVATVRKWRFEPPSVHGRPVEVVHRFAVHFDSAETRHAPAVAVTGDGAQQGPAQRFLAERGRVLGVDFVPASGYWANTYVPGDPQLRLLEARVRSHDRSLLVPPGCAVPRLHDTAHQPFQPFDPSAAAAVAVRLQADQRALNGPARLLIQVGLQGTGSHGGRRPAMNVALVLDLRQEPPLEVAAAMRALILALERSRDLGDRFSLLVAGRPDQEPVSWDRFRRGHLLVALDRLFAGQPAEEGKRVKRDADLGQVLALASQTVSRGDDPAAPLGTSTVLLVTGRRLPHNTGLAEVAHACAVAGTEVSVVGVGKGVDLDELDRIVLAGHGNRWLLQSPAEAATVVSQELSSVARVIARALQVHIRLAAGVQLVEVIGSHPLQRREVQRVRQAEQSIDLRLARSLGITADRDRDEEGILINIPSFYAGDAHVILLDVVAGGPGSIADVTVRYKDLVHLRNNVARDHLALPGGSAAPGPLQHNVVKNLLAHRLATSLRSAGADLDRGDRSAAHRRLAEMHELLAGLQQTLPWLAIDPQVAADLAMLEEYRGLLSGDVIRHDDRRQLLSDSLRYAGWRKTMPQSRATSSV